MNEYLIDFHYLAGMFFVNDPLRDRLHFIAFWERSSLFSGVDFSVDFLIAYLSPVRTGLKKGPAVLWTPTSSTFSLYFVWPSFLIVQDDLFNNFFICITASWKGYAEEEKRPTLCKNKAFSYNTPVARTYTCPLDCKRGSPYQFLLFHISCILFYFGMFYHLLSSLISQMFNSFILNLSSFLIKLLTAINKCFLRIT